MLHCLLRVQQQQNLASSWLLSSGWQHAVSQFAGALQGHQQGTIDSRRSMQSDARLPVERLQEAITPEVCAELNTKVWRTATTRLACKPWLLLHACSFYIIC
jgi:hypothetical protein